MRCFICKSRDVKPVSFVAEPPYSQWVACAACGSQTALRRYDPNHYREGLDALMVADTGGIERARDMVRENAAWFERAHDAALDRTFLDVGCGDGAMLDVMAANGWAVHGWDVFRPLYFGPHVTVTRLFHADLFPRKFAAVNAREVIEHCPWPELLLSEMREACLPGGLIQVQTPEPTDWFNTGTHTYGHLFVASAEAMREMIADAGLIVLDQMHWISECRQAGQAYLCRRPT